MKNKTILIGIGLVAGGYFIYNFLYKKEEAKSNITAGGVASGGNKKCPCYGVQTPDGSLKYSFACCKKSKA
jgi:hypothetical protein